jgi:hypothetical protein
MKQVQTMFDKEDYVQLSMMGSSFGLSFSCQEVLSDSIIGLDGLKRKLLIAKKEDALRSIHLIDLGLVRSISVKKIYKSIMAGALLFKKMDEFLDAIYLQFTLKHAHDTVMLPFYKSGTAQVMDIPALEKKARNWQTMLSKLIVSHQKLKK